MLVFTEEVPQQNKTTNELEEKLNETENVLNNEQTRKMVEVSATNIVNLEGTVKEMHQEHHKMKNNQFTDKETTYTQLESYERRFPERNGEVAK
jgi:hypothetical protein